MCVDMEPARCLALMPRETGGQTVPLPSAIRPPFINTPASGFRPVFLLKPQWVEAQLHYR